MRFVYQFRDLRPLLSECLADIPVLQLSYVLLVDGIDGGLLLSERTGLGDEKDVRMLIRPAYRET